MLVVNCEKTRNGGSFKISLVHRMTSTNIKCMRSIYDNAINRLKKAESTVY